MTASFQYIATVHTPAPLRLSDTYPSSMLKILSACFASSRLWVIMIIVCRYLLLETFKSSMISLLAFVSRLPVGSSARRMAGLVISALPMATR